jgi:hypothetical protein
MNLLLKSEEFKNLGSRSALALIDFDAFPNILPIAFITEDFPSCPLGPYSHNDSLPWFFGSKHDATHALKYFLDFSHGILFVNESHAGHSPSSTENDNL